MPVAEVLVRAAKAAALASCKSNIHSLLSNGGTGGHSAPTTAGNEARLRGSRAASHEAPPPRTFKAMAAMKRNLGNVFASKEQ